MFSTPSCHFAVHETAITTEVSGVTASPCLTTSNRVAGLFLHGKKRIFITEEELYLLPQRNSSIDPNILYRIQAKRAELEAARIKRSVDCNPDES